MRKKKMFLGARILAALVFTLALLGAAFSHAQPVSESVMRGFANAPDGTFPLSTPVVGKTDGALYGLTFQGGTNNNKGAIWKINRDGSGYRLLHSFTPSDAVASVLFEQHPFILQGSDNAIYGTTPGNTAAVGGDATTNGSVFKMSSDGNFFTVLHTFTKAEGSPITLVQGSDGALYGAGAAIFKINTDGNGYSVLHTFNAGTDGAIPFGALIQGNDGLFYGTTESSGPNGHGTVYKFDTNGTFTVLHSFGSITADGQQTFCGVVQGADAALYGMTRAGGSNSFGTVFKLNTDGAGYTNLYHFGSFSGDGERPVFGSLTEGVGGVLFGTTSAGGTNSNGTLFKIGLDGNGYNVLYKFTGGSTDGINPYGGLAAGPATGDTGVFYGTLEGAGGAAANGAIFSVLINPPVMITPVSNPTGSNGTVIFWPEWAFNYTLQMTTNLSSTNWVTVSNAAPVVGVQLTNTPPVAYFRLIYQ